MACAGPVRDGPQTLPPPPFPRRSGRGSGLGGAPSSPAVAGPDPWAPKTLGQRQRVCSVLSLTAPLSRRPAPRSAWCASGPSWEQEAALPSSRGPDQCQYLRAGRLCKELRQQKLPVSVGSCHLSPPAARRGWHGQGVWDQRSNNTGELRGLGSDRLVWAKRLPPRASVSSLEGAVPCPAASRVAAVT